MRGLVLDHEIRLDTNLPLPLAQLGEAQIQVLQAGICSTDLHMIQGYMSFQGILGHEFVGIVNEASDTSLVGKRVVGEINAACRRCETCLQGRPTHCPHRTTLGIFGRDGAFAEFLSLPLENLFVLPDSISDDQAVFIEPLAAACEIPQLVSVKPTDHVVIIGDGKLGLLCAQVLTLSGCAVSLLGRHPHNHSWLRKAGIFVTSDIQEIPVGVDIVVEASGSPDGLGTAVQVVRPRGTIVLKSTFHGHVSINMTELVIQEISLIGSRCGPFAPAIRLLEGGLIQVAPLIHAHFPLTEGITALNQAAQRGTLKIMLHMT
ncbi:MAG: alcohol dehydrogenase catalytic domain-containing protein [Nitrospirales bacterium]